MNTYPLVRDEFQTLRRVLAGASLARYGDGEFNLCGGTPAKAQAVHSVLCRRLREILQESGSCMVGIPNLHSDTPKTAFWQKYYAAAQWLVHRPYCSAFISRPDSAPWINTPEYWAQLESLWAGQDVTLVRGNSNGLSRDDLTRARHVTEVIAPRENAFTDYDELLEVIGRPQRALLCLGPTATVLAVDLCVRGVHAIDLGHAGLFLRKYRRGEPMVVTQADKVAV